MIPIPKKIKILISSKEISQIENWWEKLNPENQLALEQLYEEKNPHQEMTISIFLCGKYVEQERPHENDILGLITSMVTLSIMNQSFRLRHCIKGEFTLPIKLLLKVSDPALFQLTLFVPKRRRIA